jgi:superoxide dismutase, Cu-Zn family
MEPAGEAEDSLEMRLMRALRWLWVVVLVSFAVFWILVATANARVTAATATVHDVHGHDVGTVALNQLAGGHTLVRYTLHGMPGGFHAFHVHAVGACDARTDFRSAGRHYDKLGRVRPFDGAMPTILVDADGTALGSFVTDRFQVADVVGRAVIVHLRPDNFANVPLGTGPTEFRPNSPFAVTKMLRSGDAGTNLACGVIRAKS